MLNNYRKRCLLVGILNTTVGYFLGLVIYSFTQDILWLPIILFFINAANISLSFLTYKLLVFNTRGNWVIEYLKCYIVYGANFILSMMVVWVLVEELGYRFWIAQGIALVIGVFLSFFLHDKFTFSNKKI